MTTVIDHELPLAPNAPGAWRRQREAASRNETAIVDAASALFRDRGVENVDVRDIAAAAGVGIGTVYRRFGDKASVIAAAIGEQERALQDALLSGPPPLGPGAPPRERLAAFLAALCELTERNLDVLAASEGSSPGARYRIGAYHAWCLHVSVILSALDVTLDGRLAGRHAARTTRRRALPPPASRPCHERFPYPRQSSNRGGETDRTSRSAPIDAVAGRRPGASLQATDR